MKRKTSTAGRDYILHIGGGRSEKRLGEMTLCGREATAVNCTVRAEEHKLTEESGCRVCVRKYREKMGTNA